MSPRRDDDDFDIDLPWVRVNLGGRRWRRTRAEDIESDGVIEVDLMERDDYSDVRHRVRRRLRFFRHAFTFLLLNGLFVLLDWSTGGAGSGVNWSQWVALIWGIFLAWEFVRTFVGPTLWGRDVEERMIERELRKRRGT
jgi:hypothetical protein